MSTRNPNYRLVKKLRLYTVHEAAELFGVHKNTIRAWIEDGLAVCDNQRPILILGWQLSSYLLSRLKSRKQPCEPGQMYCFRCRAPREPAGNMADFQEINEKVGNLTAICPNCECFMNQRVSLAKLAKFPGKLEVAFPLSLRRLSESNPPSVNNDLKEKSSSCRNTTREMNV